MTIANNYPTVKMGGFFRRPKYLESYYEETQILMQSERIDYFAMPILYLQRHTVELLLKELLDGAQNVIAMTQEIQKAKRQPVLDYNSKNSKHHNLNVLLSDAEMALAALGWPVPVVGLNELVSLCTSTEQGDETRWRYPKGKGGKPSFPGGIGECLDLPIYEIQQRLTQIAEEEQIGKTYDDVMKADSISSYCWSLSLTEHQLLQELYSLGLL